MPIENDRVEPFGTILAAVNGPKGEVVGVVSARSAKETKDRGPDRNSVRRDGGIAARRAGGAGCAISTARTTRALRTNMTSGPPRAPRSLRACLAILSVAAIGPLRPRGLLDLRQLLLNAGGKA